MVAFGNDPAKGEPEIIYRPQGGAPPFPILAVFDRAYLDMVPLGGGGGAEARPVGAVGNISARKPVLGVTLDQFPVEPRQKDVVVVGTDIFTVREFRPDGHGWALLLLSKGLP